MPKTVFRLLCGITDHWRDRWIEWTLGWLLIAQGIRLQSPQEPNINRLYLVVYNFLSPSVIAPVAIGIGGVWVTALFLNGTFSFFRQISPWLRSLCSLAAMMYWAFWAVTLYKAATVKAMFSVSWVNHGCLSFMALMCLLTLADEVAAVDRKAKVWRRQRKIGHL